MGMTYGKKQAGRRVSGNEKEACEAGGGITGQGCDKGALHCFLVGCSDDSRIDRRMAGRKQPSRISRIQRFLASRGAKVRILWPYYTMSAMAVVMAMFVGGALSSAADMIRYQSYIQGQAEVVRMIPINVLTTIDVGEDV